MKSLFLTHWRYFVVAVICFIVGILIARKTNETEVKTRYIKGVTIYNTLHTPDLTPVKVEIPERPVLPVKIDTIWIEGQIKYITQVVDTAAIIADYIKKNTYQRTLFDDNNGRLDIEADVQYNILQRLHYGFTPIYKEVTVERSRVFVPVIAGSYNTLGYYGIGGGAFYRNFGVVVKYMHGVNNYYVDISALYKF